MPVLFSGVYCLVLYGVMLLCAPFVAGGGGQVQGLGYYGIYGCVLLF